MVTAEKISPSRIEWLILPPILLCALDFGLTLLGQSSEYWAGNYSQVNELSPSFAHYLALHPWVFVAAGLLWVVMFSTVIALLPEFFALTISIAIVIGHMGGAFTWLAYRFHNYQACNAMLLITALIVVFSFKRGQNQDGSAAFDWKRTGLPQFVRWVLVGILIILPTWWFLIPH